MAGVGHYAFAVAYDAALTADGEADVVSGETLHVAVVISHFSHDDDEVAAVRRQLLAHIVGIEAQLG